MSKQFRSIIMYLVVGGFTTLVNILTYWAFSELLDLDYRLATTISWIIAVLFAYVANKKFVFESYSPTLRHRLREMSSFFGFRLLSFLIDLTVMIALVSGMAVNDFWAKICANIIVLIANYVFSRWFVFKKAVIKEQN